MKRAVNKLDERMQTAQTKVNEKEAQENGSEPIVITAGGGGGGGFSYRSWYYPEATYSS